ncbi:MAG: hypothetical protein ACLP1D_01300 [Xanthobacteraceae bacterium]|jgi:hypothetical protein
MNSISSKIEEPGTTRHAGISLSAGLRKLPAKAKPTATQKRRALKLCKQAVEKRGDRA